MIKSRTRGKWCAILTGAAVGAGVLQAAGTDNTSQWVHPGPDGKLIYKSTPKGDRIMDFSQAGYMGGGVALPVVPVKRTVSASGREDDTSAIQSAIDAVAALPLEKGFRGAVWLEPGIYSCSNSIRIMTSGIVLRGGGDGAGPGQRTIIRLTGRPHTGIAVGIPRRLRRQTNARPAAGMDAEAIQGFKPAETRIADKYVPSGATTFTVADASGLAVGDTIEVRRPVTEAWIRFMRMDDLMRDGRPQTWIRAGSTRTARRHITAIAGNKITVDVPLSDSFDSKYLNPPGTAVVKIRPPARINQVGIELLRIKSPPQEINHTRPHFSAIRINGEDCWVRDVVCDETMNSVSIGGRRITLTRVAVYRKARHQGSSKPAEFGLNATQLLLDRCTVSADNVWFAATGAGVPGPVVLLNCTFHGEGRAESHQRWSTGMLYDHCRAPEGGFDFRNRGSMGSGHGWTMGWGVAWNCVAKDYVIQNPPGAVNWMIGCIGKSTLKPRPFGKAPLLPEGTKDSPGVPVLPQSLYLAQLAERLGSQALRNIGY